MYVCTIFEYICIYIEAIEAALISVVDSNHRLLSNLPAWHINCPLIAKAKNIPLHPYIHIHIIIYFMYIFI